MAKHDVSRIERIDTTLVLIDGTSLNSGDISLQDLHRRSDQEVEITFRNFSDLRPSRIPRYLDIFDQIHGEYFDGCP